jgi:hypothetical protein
MTLFPYKKYFYYFLLINQSKLILEPLKKKIFLQTVNHLSKKTL